MRWNYTGYEGKAVFTEYESLMQFWMDELDLPILPVQYEELVADTDGRLDTHETVGPPLAYMLARRNASRMRGRMG